MVAVFAASSSVGLEGPGWQARQSAAEGLPRTVTVSFGDEIEAVWNAADCRLVGVWRASQLLVRAAPEQPVWLLRSDTQQSELEAELRGYRRSGDDLILDCRLRLPDGGEVWIEELPSLVHSDDGTPGLRRTFRTYDVPAGHRVWTDVSIAPMPRRRDLLSNGDLKRRSRQRIRRVLRRASATEAELGLLSNGATRLEAYFASVAEVPTSLEREALAPHTTELEEGAASTIDDSVNEGEAPLRRGLSMRVWDIGQPMIGLYAMDPSLRPNVATVIPTVDLDEADDFGGPRDRFRTTVSGFLVVDEPGTYELRLTADDGAAVWVDGRPLIEYQGGFTTHSASADVDLGPGLHPIRIEHFDNVGGQVLRLEWKPPSATEMVTVPVEAFRSDGDFLLTAPGTKAIADIRFNRVPGNGLPPAGAHPAYRARQIVVEGLPGDLIDLALDSEDRLVVAERGGEGRIFAVEGLFGEPPTPSVRQLAAGLREPLAVRSVGRQIFVLQNRELLQLVDVTGDGIIDEHWTFAAGWPALERNAVHGRLHYRDDTFTLRLGPVDRSAAAAENLVLEVTSEGSWLQIPGQALDREIFALGPAAARGPFEATIRAEDSGSAARIVHGADLRLSGYDGHSVIVLDDGSLARVVPERVDGRLQAAIIPFAALEAAGPIEAVLATRGGALLVSHRPPVGHRPASTSPGLASRTFTRLDPDDRAPFEIAAVRAKANGIEIELSEPLGGRAGWDPADYLLRQHRWESEDQTERPPLAARSELLKVRSASVSADRRRIFLETPRLQPPSLIYLRLLGPFVGESGRRPWSAEAWYSLLSEVGDRGEVRLGPILTSPNTLTESERANRWRLLFDGESLKGWRGYRRSDTPSAWRVADGLLMLGSEGERGDLITERQYSDFELVLEWAVAPGGNSGILYRVSESADASHWTGPEYQILDEETGDGRGPHSTGANYALHTPRYPASRGPLRFNETRIVVDDGRVEHWLNGYLVAQYELGSDDWLERVRKSKFADRKGYGRQRRGHLALQDHGNEVWFRSIKLREL